MHEAETLLPVDVLMLVLCRKSRLWPATRVGALCFVNGALPLTPPPAKASNRSEVLAHCRKKTLCTWVEVGPGRVEPRAKSSANT